MTVTTEAGITTKRGKRVLNQDAFFHYAQLLDIPCIDTYEDLTERLHAVKNQLSSGIRQGFSNNQLLKEGAIRELMKEFPVIYSFMEHLLTHGQRRDDHHRLDELEGFIQRCLDLPVYVRLYGIPIKSQRLDSIESATSAYQTIQEEDKHKVFTDVFQQLKDKEKSFFANWNTAEMPEHLESLKSVMVSRGRLFAVADGVSGAQEGHIAAQLSTRLLRNYYESGEHGAGRLSCGDILAKTIGKIDRQLAQLDIVTATALTAVLIEAGNADNVQCQAFWVGDVEAYWVQNTGQIELWTGGHGELPPEEANANPVRYLGTRYGAYVHRSEKKTLHAGDQIVIASDGVTRSLRPSRATEPLLLIRQEIASLVAASTSPQDASQQLVKQSEHHSADNLTAMVIHIRKTL
jgi:serine/threonine protein phosphatase PrpC